MKEIGKWGGIREMNIVIQYLINQIKNLKNDKPLIIGFDGVDTSGKTTLADLIAEGLSKEPSIKPIRISIDKFHNPKEIRMRQGSLSPKGYFEDSFNYDVIINQVFQPIKEGKENILLGIYDYRYENEIEKVSSKIDNNSVVLFDGVFLLRDELYPYWDLSVFLEVDFTEVIKRALKRDITLFGSDKEVLNRYENRYIPGQQLYINKVHPQNRANIVIDNNDYKNPKIIKYLSNN